MNEGPSQLVDRNRLWPYSNLGLREKLILSGTVARSKRDTRHGDRPHHNPVPKCDLEVIVRTQEHSRPM